MIESSCLIGQEEQINRWDGGRAGEKDAGQTSWLSPDLFVKTSLTSFMIALFLTTVAVYVNDDNADNDNDTENDDNNKHGDKNNDK